MRISMKNQDPYCLLIYGLSPLPETGSELVEGRGVPGGLGLEYYLIRVLVLSGASCKGVDLPLSVFISLCVT